MALYTTNSKTVCVLCFMLLVPFHSVLLRPLSLFESIVQYYRQDVVNPERFIKNTRTLKSEYDFIVVGAGSAGSVVASRLSEISDWSVLLVEEGRDENFLTDIPLMTSYILAFSNYAKKYYAQKDPDYCLATRYKRCLINKGRALGGSSTINFMIYSRGSSRDFDKWSELGNDGWRYEEVLPYFLKSEDIGIPEFQNSPLHSKGGNLRVERARYRSKLAEAFVQSGQELGYPVADVAALTQEGFDFVAGTLRKGERCSTSRAYLRDMHKRPNLHVAQQARVTKVLIDPTTNRAYGIQMIRGGVKQVVRARKEVVLSAGSIGSPQLLMLSGVGPRDHLAGLGIPVMQDLKVGHNLQDHVSLAGLTFLVNYTDTLLETRLLFNPQYTIEYMTNRSGILSLPAGAEGIAFLKTKYATLDDDPDIELVFGLGSLNLEFIGTVSYGVLGLDSQYRQKLFSSIMGQDSFSIVPILMKPHSRGLIKLRSKDPLQPPLIYPNYFQDERDIRVLVDGIKMAVAVARSQAFQRFGARLHTTPYPGCEGHVFESDAYWECCIRYMTSTIQHQVGTCKMGPDSDPDAVVDPYLRVRGVTGLRVVDSSIAPLIPTGHTNAMAIMIGEKASDLIKQTWLPLPLESTS